MTQDLRVALIRYVTDNGPCYPGVTLRALADRFPQSEVGWAILKLLDKDREDRAFKLDSAGKLVCI